MKKLIAVVLVVLTVFSVSMLFAAADGNEIKVNVTITDKQRVIALAMKEVTVTDIDGDNALTINDVLYAAHEQNYTGGAAAGYGTETTKYGLSLTKLWGVVDGYNYGYTVNDIPAWSLGDVVKEGDYIAAYCYSDTKTFADTYSYFTPNTVTAGETGELALTLKMIVYDQEGMAQAVAAPGAELTVDGQTTGVFTDVEGRATLTLSDTDKHVISAVSTTKVLVPPICLVKAAAATQATDTATVATQAATQSVTEASTEDVTQATGTEAVIESSTEDVTQAPTEDATVAATEETLPATKDQATKDQATKDQKNTTSPKTGDRTNTVLWIVITLLSLCGIGCIAVIYKKRYEK